jgi:hypothetical protein
MDEVNIDQQASGYIRFGADSVTQLRRFSKIRIAGAARSQGCPAETQER